MAQTTLHAPHPQATPSRRSPCSRSGGLAAALAVATLSSAAAASITQIDKVLPTNPNGTGGYVQGTGVGNNSLSGLGSAFASNFADIAVFAQLSRTGASGSSSLIYAFDLQSDVGVGGSQQAISTATMQLVFTATTTATLEITTFFQRTGDQFRYAEVSGSATTVPVGDWKSISATGQFTNTFAAGTYTFLVEFFNNGGGVPFSATRLTGTWSFTSAAAPIPGTGLAAIGSLGLAGMARRRRR